MARTNRRSASCRNCAKACGSFKLYRALAQIRKFRETNKPLTKRINFIKFHKWFSNRFLDGFKAFCTIAKPQFVVKKHDTRHGPVSSWSFPIFARLHRLTASQRGLARRAARAEGRVVPGGPIDDLYGRWFHAMSWCGDSWCYIGVGLGLDKLWQIPNK